MPGMSLLMRRPHCLPILLLLSFCGGEPEPPPAAPPRDILARLREVPGLEVEERSTMRAGYRFFHLQFDQPADHGAPTAQWFRQRLTLLHRTEGAETAPTVITTSGYFVSLRDGVTEVTRLLGANQIAAEHRFFGPSRPEPADWRHLTIAQAAADHHRIIAALRAIYRGRWISTGGSKGGMASVFHRRFFPDDVDGTVAYVAPLLRTAPDTRYDDYIDRVGMAPEDPTCGTKLRAFQQLALSRRAALEMKMTQLPGLMFSHLTIPVALEHAVLELPFYFWQYGDAAGCAKIPAEGAGDQEVFAFLNQVHPLREFADDDVAAFQPYYYQAGTEEGYPGFAEAHLQGLLVAPGSYVPRTYLPRELMVSYDPRPMADVDQWVRTQGRRILFIYGESDPWSAAPFDIGEGAAARSVHLLWVPRGNHGARIAQLPEADRSRAEAALREYAGVPALVPAAQPLLVEAGGEIEWGRRPALDR
jgi:hypothetical protein